MAKVDFRKGVLTGAASVLALALATGTAFAQGIDFNIDAQPLDKALLDFNAQSGVTVAAPRELVNGKSSAPVRGEMEPADALDVLLADSGLHATRLSSGAYTVTLRNASLDEEQVSQPFRVAQVDQESVVQELKPVDEGGDEVAPEDVIVVTGTNLRGVKNPTSPVFVFDAEDIRLSGAATTQEFIRTLPQNLDLSENIGTTLAGQPTFDSPSTAGVNLRGLGGGATLTLVNGRRLATGDGRGSFVDISLIPLAAIQRIEVLTDGASAIYGSDAVAGVVNIILRDDYEGAETQLRVGTATRGRGSPQEFQATQTIGSAWQGGNVTASYEYYRRNNLAARDRQFTETAPTPADLLPNTQRHGILLTANHNFSERLQISGTGVFSTRSSSNAFLDLFSGGDIQQENQDKQISATLGLEYTFENDWRVDLSGGFSRNDSNLDANNSGGFVAGAQSDVTMWSADLVVDGMLFDIAGGEVRTAFGGHFRSEEFKRLSFDSIEQERDVYAVFAEVNVPIIGASNRLPAIYALDLSAATRYEEFSDVGSSINPKIGLRYAPAEQISFRGTYSTAFQAASFFDIGFNQVISAVPGFFFPSPPGTTSPNPDLLIFSGGNLDLEPERSTNFTGGFDYDPAFISGARISLTYFGIDYDDRVGTPGTGVFAIFLDPDSFGDSLTVNPDLDTVLSLFSDPRFVNGFGVQPENVGVIFDQRRLNLSRTEVRGLDFELDYITETDIGSLNFGISGSYLFDIIEQSSPVAAAVETLNTVGNPIDLRFRANAGWSRDGYGVNLFVNYANDYISEAAGPEIVVPSWTTVDLNLTYDTSFLQTTGLLDGVRLNLNIRNLFDEDPPFVTQSLSPGVNYDGANANALGRTIALTVTKAW